MVYGVERNGVIYKLINKSIKFITIILLDIFVMVTYVSVLPFFFFPCLVFRDEDTENSSGICINL